MKKILLTGANGLIGKYAIQPLLDAGFEVFAVSSKETNTKYQMPNVQWISANLLELDDAKNIFEQIKPEYLLHFAWDTTPKTYLESDLNYKWLESSLEMLKQFKKYGGKRAVLAGTCFEYEFQDEPLKENETKLNPTSTYAKCKNELREKAQEFCTSNDISFGWGRIFYVFGEGENENRLVPKVVSYLKDQRAMVFTTGELVKDYMFAGDIAGGFVKFLDSNVEGCVNICSANPIKIKELVNIIAKKMGKEHLLSFEPKKTGEPEIIVGENKRLIEEVGYTPKQSLDSALDLIIK